MHTYIYIKGNLLLVPYAGNPVDVCCAEVETPVLTAWGRGDKMRAQER